MNARLTMTFKALTIIFLLLIAGGVPVVWAQDTTSSDTAQEDPPADSAQEAEVFEKPVMLDDQVLFHVATKAGGYLVEKRAKEISKRIKTIADAPQFKVDAVTSNDFNGPLTLILVGGELVMSVLDADAAIKGMSRQELAAEYVDTLRTAIQKYRKDRSVRQLVKDAIYALIGTVIFVGILILLAKLKTRIDRAIDKRFKAWKKGLQIQSLEIIQAGKINGLLKGGVKGIRIILVLLFSYIYLHVLLGLSPWTRPFAVRILDYVLSPLTIIAKGFVNQIPNLIFLAILILILRYFLKVMRLFFEGIENQRVKLPGFYPEWAKSTYRLLSFLTIAFFIVIAFPYIPGSDSLAFKGVSVFVGVLFSLGSQSAVSNIVAGFALTYRRAFLVGDRVKIADFSGDVIETRLQVTTLKTVKNEEIVVPNSLILNSHVVNYSAEARRGGLILYTNVSIGYDTPWRQVHAMLLMAARRTSGLLAEPAPFVLQKSLDDFYVVYELNAYTDAPEKMAVIYSRLHQNILDIFNEYGVQIMSPNYIADKNEPTLVPKERWYPPPAEPEDASE